MKNTPKMSLKELYLMKNTPKMRLKQLKRAKNDYN